MKKKLVLPLALVLLISLFTSSVASAQASQPEQSRNSGRRSAGQVTAVGDQKFSITTRSGSSYEVLVDESTRFWGADQSEASFEDLEVGQWVITITTPATGQADESQAQFTARRVVLLPEEIDLSQRFGIRVRGVVTGTDLSASTFSLRDRNGQILTLAVDQKTQFIGQPDSLRELQPGMNVAAAGHENGAGYPLAVIVAARLPVANHAGEISAVNLDSRSFSLETVRNGVLRFQVDDQTRFRSPDQTIQTLEDLQPGMLATVAARQDGTQLIALLVAAADRSDLPQVDLRLAGSVVSIGADSFMVEKASGEQITILVIPETRFRSRIRWVQGLDDLRAGMKVVVGANEGASGFEAVVVVVSLR